MPPPWLRTKWLHESISLWGSPKCLSVGGLTSQPLPPRERISWWRVPTWPRSWQVDEGRAQKPRFSRQERWDPCPADWYVRRPGYHDPRGIQYWQLKFGFWPSYHIQLTEGGLVIYLANKGSLPELELPVLYVASLQRHIKSDWGKKWDGEDSE